MNQKDFLKLGSYRIDEIKNLAEKRKSHFFDDDTMKFFSSRLSGLCWIKDSNIYFITSEADQSYIKHKGSKRAFTIRKCVKGDIINIGQFQEYETLNKARQGIKKILEHEDNKKNE